MIVEGHRWSGRYLSPTRKPDVTERLLASFYLFIKTFRANSKLHKK